MAIVVKHYDVETYEDVLEEGESTSMGTCWNGRDIPIDEAFTTAREALNAVAEANGWNPDKVYWMDRHAEGVGESGTYDGDILVDVDNAEANAGDVEAWKRGERRLWNARIYVELSWREERSLTEAEAAI